MTRDSLTLIAYHEGGHVITARALNVRVTGVDWAA